jgi:Secretion system C-terminal sorting domain/F5/8 type C domain
MRAITSIIVGIVLIQCFSTSLQAQVPYTDRHSQVQSDAWISSTKSTSPNASRGVLHWIRYDLGDTYSIHKSKFWNVNVPGSLNVGAKSIIIDYSIDGTTWIEWGRYELPQGSGSTLYEGEDGPNFSGLVARHILLNITSNYGHASRSGLAEVKFEVAPVTTAVTDGTSKQYNISIHPNPTSSIANIGIEGLTNFDNVYYQITDASGKSIESKKLNGSNITYDVKNLSAGIYNFSVIYPGGAKSTSLNVVK